MSKSGYFHVFSIYNTHEGAKHDSSTNLEKRAASISNAEKGSSICIQSGLLAQFGDRFWRGIVRNRIGDFEQGGLDGRRANRHRLWLFARVRVHGGR